MRHSLTLGGALLALTVLTSAAEAGPLGGISTSPAFSCGGDTRIAVTPSLGGARNFGGSMRSTFPGAQSFSAAGLELRGKSTHWKKPNEPGDGEGDDPPKKPQKDPAGGSGPRLSDDGYRGGWNYPGHYGGYHGGYGSGDTEPPLACRGRINGC